MDTEFNPQTTPTTPSPAPVQAPQVTQPGPVVKLVVGLLIVAIAYMVGYKSGARGYTFQAKSFEIVNKSEQPQTVDYNLLWDAIDAVNKNYIDKPINQQDVLYGAVQGAVSSVGDPYTAYFPPKQLENFQTTLKGSFGGIGAEVGKQNGNIVIVAPLDGTPAKRAGLLAKDIIAQVDGQSTQDWTVEQAVEKIRGPKGSQVKLTIVREGKDRPFEVSITRDNIVIKSVKWEIKDVEGKKIAVITMSQFGDDTTPLFNQAVNEVLSKSVDGIVVDLRNNPGGYLQSAVDVASNWVKSGEAVVTEAHVPCSDGAAFGPNCGSNVYNSSGSSRLSGMRTVVLINGGTASASEILSGALRDHQLAKLIGEKSFGKGSVQELIELPEGGAVKVTVAKWITPSGKNLNRDGLAPDIEVKLSDDDIASGKDPQMDKALEEITK